MKNKFLKYLLNEAPVKMTSSKKRNQPMLPGVALQPRPLDQLPVLLQPLLLERGEKQQKCGGPRCAQGWQKRAAR